MSVHPEAIVNGVTPTHNTVVHADLARWWNHRRDPLNALDPEFGIVGDGADESAALADFYAAGVATGRPLHFPKPPVAYGYASDLDWDDNTVSVIGAGSGLVTLQAIGTARINIRPATFTATQGPSIGGFTVQGDGTAGGTGIYTGDITGYHFDDIVVQGFTGAGAIGIHVATDTQTEINVWERLHLNGNTIGIKWTNSSPSLNSLARNNFHRLHINVNAGQTGWMMRDNGNLYTSVLNITGNMAGAGTFFDIGDTATINGCFIDIGMEQTSGSGGIPYTVATTAFVFGYGVARFENFSGWTGAISGGARHSPGWRIMGPEAVVNAVDSQVEGQIANFLGSGNAGNVHPVLWDSAQDPYATVGFITGTNIRSPFVVMYDSPASAFMVYKVGAGGAPNALTEVFRGGANGVLTALVGFRPGRFSTAGRNALGAATVGEGVEVYDTTLHKPVWSDGSAWRDAAGTVV